MFRTMATIMFCALLVFAPTSRYVRQKSYSAIEVSLLEGSDEPVASDDGETDRNVVVGAEIREAEKEKAKGQTVDKT